jgi:carboxylesterase
MAALINPPASPARDFAEATERAAKLQLLDGTEVYPTSHTQLLSHGSLCKRAILLLHGFTASPSQFRQLGEAFFDRGYNVLIPRAPFHGLADSRTTRFVELTARQLLEYLNEALDITFGLGEEVTVAGLSMGGVLAAWAAQFRPGIELAASISSAFGARLLPYWLTRPAVWLAQRLPNVFLFDNPRADPASLPPGVYPRMATRPLAHIFELSLALFEQARHAPPTARRVLMITNPSDLAVNNRAAELLVNSWRSSGAQNVETFVFDPEWRLPHDLIHPEHAQQQTGRVYPVLLDLLTSDQRSSA